jgi:hypothetical protein
MIGRARRLGSEQRELIAFHYYAIGPNKESTVDDLIIQVARHKDAVNLAIRTVVSGEFDGNQPVLFKSFEGFTAGK